MSHMMPFKSKSKLIIGNTSIAVAIGVSSLVVSAPVFAQDARSRVLEEIVVTAQRRTESMQDVPISMQAFSDDRLQSSGITTFESLTMVVPGFNSGRTAGGNATYLRGIGASDSSAGQESPVATYVDGVYRQSLWSNNMSLKNVDRVEVLKGPQGTLFGRNATGGLVHIITKDPVPETSGELSFKVGNYDTYEVSGYGSTEIASGLSADFTAYIRRQEEGYGKNLITGGDSDFRDESTFRTKWLYSQNEKTEVRVSLDYSEVEDAKGLNRNVLKNTTASNGIVAHGDYHDVEHDVDAEVKTRTYGASMQVDHQFNHFDLVSITAYRDDDTSFMFDNDGGPLPINVADITYYNELFTQEFRIASNSDKNYNWMMGVFYMQGKAEADLAVLVGPTRLQVARIESEMDLDSYSAFVEYSHQIGKNGRLTLGARYTMDERRVSGAVNGAVVPDQKDDWGDPTWRIVYDHHITENAMVFASYNRGFKSGNFNVLPPVTPSYDPETIDAFEVGTKASFNDGRVQFNASAFYYDYKDIHARMTSQFTTTVQNAASAEIKGLEVELAAMLTDRLSINVGSAWVDSEYESFPDAEVYVPAVPGQPCPSGVIPVGGNCATSMDVSGNQMARSPEFTATLGATLDIPVRVGTLIASTHIYYNSGYPWDASNRIEEDSYRLVNASLAWRSSDDRWGIRLSGENITDTDYAVYGGSVDTMDYFSAGSPRTYSITIDTRF